MPKDQRSFQSCHLLPVDLNVSGAGQTDLITPHSHTRFLPESSPPSTPSLWGTATPAPEALLSSGLTQPSSGLPVCCPLLFLVLRPEPRLADQKITSDCSPLPASVSPSGSWVFACLLMPEQPLFMSLFLPLRWELHEAGSGEAFQALEGSGRSQRSEVLARSLPRASPSLPVLICSTGMVAAPQGTADSKGPVSLRGGREVGAPLTPRGANLDLLCARFVVSLCWFHLRPGT